MSGSTTIPATVETRAQADYERATGEAWADLPAGAKVEYRAIAERAIRSEEAQPIAEPPADPAPAQPSPTLADPEQLAELSDRAASTPATVRDVAKMIGMTAPTIRAAIEARTGPLAERIEALEARLAKLEKAAPKGKRGSRK